MFDHNIGVVPMQTQTYVRKKVGVGYFSEDVA